MYRYKALDNQKLFKTPAPLELASYTALWSDSRLDLSSNNGQEKLAVIPWGVSLDHLVEGLVIALQESLLYLHQVNLHAPSFIKDRDCSIIQYWKIITMYLEARIGNIYIIPRGRSRVGNAGHTPLLQADGTSSSVLIVTTTWSSSTRFAQNYAKIPADIAATSPISYKKATFSALVWLVAMMISSKRCQKWAWLHVCACTISISVYCALPP